MTMKTQWVAVLAATILSSAGAAHAGIVFSDNFNGENGGVSALNYAGFANFTVSDGTVDLLNGFPGLSCVSGGCVDLDGSTGNAGTMMTSGLFSFNAGDVVTFSFDLSGNQRNGAQDSFTAGFKFAGVTALDYYSTGGAFGVATPFTNFFTGDINTSAGVASGSPFQTYTLSFRAASAGQTRIYIGAAGGDNIGPIVDNVTLSTTAVPEPSTWAMMLLGFGSLGAILRRRRAPAYA
ncbi:PEPxxWA-CTERM sorting domain-containing protein [Phenylobacterium kunshanense]|nr:PEPxxWA-CTERM sorting domain-containing protein [Phenylobacterium kunshanense]